MIITDKLVFLHSPKTGGTFVSKVLKKLQQRLAQKYPGMKPKYKDLRMFFFDRINFRLHLTQHINYCRIPERYKGRPIIGCIRNPYDRYVSRYEYRNWAKNPPAKKKCILKSFPEYPDLTFGEYIELDNTIEQSARRYANELKIDIGMYTFHFIQMYFKDPRKVFNKIDEDYINSEAYKDDMPNINFLRTENLNVDLYHALLSLGYNEEDIAFILDEGKILPGGGRRRTDQDWKKYYTPELLNYVRRKERFLFKLFPEYDRVDREEGLNA